MTVSAGVFRSDYLGDGVQVDFAVGFQALAEGDLAVYLTDPNDTSNPVKLTLTMDYTVSGNLYTGTGVVTMLVAPAAGYIISILRNMTLSQETDYEQYDDFPADSHERALDKLTMISQEQQEKLARVPIMPESVVLDLKFPAPKANTAILWNDDETALVNGPTASQIASANAAAVAAEAARSLAELAQAEAANSASVATAAAASLPSLAGNANRYLQVNEDASGYNLLTASEVLAAIGAEPADADIVKAPGGVLPVLDGSNLTGIVAGKVPPPQTVVQANMGTRPSGWAAEDSDLPTETLTFSGGTLTVEPGLQVAAADSGNIILSEVLSAAQTIDMGGESDGDYYVYADLNADGTFDTFGFSSIPPEVRLDRVTPGSDLYNPATLTMVDSTDTLIRRVYVGEVTIATSLISAVYSYALGTHIVLPVNGGSNVTTNTGYPERKPYPGPVEAVAEIYSTTMSKWVRTINFYSSSTKRSFGTWVRTIDNSFIYVKTARNYIAGDVDISGPAMSTGKCRLIVRRGY